MASKLEAVEVTEDAIIVFVTHLPTDSFSRSVNRVTRNAWRGSGANADKLMATRHRAARYAHTQLDDGRFLSTSVYTYSWDHGYAILEQLHGPK